MRRRWKHPYHVDTYATLADARAALPGCPKFRRVLCGNVVKFREGVYDCEIIAPRRHQ